MSAATFDVHGVVVEVRSNRAELLELVRRRLSFFGAASGQRVAATFDLLAVNNQAVSRPPGPVRTVYEPETGEVLYDPEHDELYVDYGRVRARCRAAAGETLVAALDPVANSAWAITRPLFTLPLLEVLKRRGIYGVHAAAVAQGGRAITLAGGSGIGKTTLAVAFAHAGFDFLGDDMVFLSEVDGELAILAFPDELDVSERTVSFFPEVGDRLRPDLLPGSPKRQLPPDGSVGAVIEAADPAILLFPRIVMAAERSSLEPLDRDQALLELAPNVLLTDSPSSQRHLEILGRLAGKSSCYRLSVARDFDEVVRLVEALPI